MNWKPILIGALAFWVVSNIIGMFGTGFVIHGVILEPAYRATEAFWRPELRQDPPDMAALMPYWMVMSFLGALIAAGIYSCVGSVFSGPGWKRGLTWGLCLSFISFGSMLGYSGVFNLPMTIWTWWGIDHLIVFLVSGAAMGWAVERVAGG